MYELLIFSVIAALLLILFARRYPIPTAMVYTFALLYFVGFSSGRSGLGGMSIRFPCPFWNAMKSGHYGLSTNRSVLNMVLFIPFGYILPTICARCQSEHEQNGATEKKVKGWQIILAGFLTSLIIETGQIFFKCGVFELDDLVKNTMGAAVGWLIWRGTSLKPHQPPQDEESSNADN